MGAVLSQADKVCYRKIFFFFFFKYLLSVVQLSKINHCKAHTVIRLNYFTEKKKF